MSLVLLPPRRRSTYAAATIDDAPKPATPPSATTTRANLAAAGGAATQPPSLLIVDDDPLMTELLPRRLRRALVPELRILTASTPEDGLRLAETEQPDVILSDYNLRASITGLDVLKEAAVLAPAATRILFSAHTKAEIGPQLEGAPIHGFIEKTMRLDEIVSPLVALVRESRGLDLARPDER